MHLDEETMAKETKYYAEKGIDKAVKLAIATIGNSMKDLMNISKEQTMSSREIATLTGKQHYDVVKSIENTLEQAEISSGEFRSTEEVRGKQVVIYNLPKMELR
jgi:hypothetical protein